MHTPGHNPYQTTTQQYITAMAGPMPSFLEYEYQGISPDIMQALMGAFDFGDLIEFNPLSSAYARNIQDYFIGGPEGYGIDTALGLTDIFDPESLAVTLSQVGDADITAAEVKALTPEMIDKTTSAYYLPYEEAERASLVERKGKALSGASTGGFAGSAGRQAGLSGAERLYQGGYGDLLADIEKMKAQSTEDVLDTIYGWQELMSQLGQ